jgi:hypothetical protein
MTSTLEALEEKLAQRTAERNREQKYRQEERDHWLRELDVVRAELAETKRERDWLHGESNLRGNDVCRLKRDNAQLRAQLEMLRLCHRSAVNECDIARITARTIRRQAIDFGGMTFKKLEELQPWLTEGENE